MNWKIVLSMVFAFVLGMVTYDVISAYSIDENPVITQTFIKESQRNIENNQTILTKAAEVVGFLSPERASPQDRISIDDIKWDGKKVTIYIDNPQISTFADTNSMDPLIDVESTAIQIEPKSKEDIHVGDVISYQYKEDIIIHRVIEIGYFNESNPDTWYAIAKGDNNTNPAPYPLSYNQISRILIGVIY